MTDSEKCPRCGAPRSPEDPGALCPACLLAAGQAGEETLGAESAASVPSPDELSEMLPDLEVRELLGSGGMGVVYRARQTRLNRDVAVKILSPDITHNDEFAQRFTREAHALASLSHPNIVAVHDFGEVQGLYYIVMELVRGANLRQVIRQQTLSAREALAIVPALCDALQYAHDHGVVHRDIKPENVLLTEDGKIKIVDFGLAKTVARDSNTTATARAMGTPAYMAPEQIEHPDTVDHRADIYSMGVVIYEMLTGELPLGRFDPPSHRVRIDVRLDDVVLRTLEKERERRYQKASDVRTDIETIATSAPRAPHPTHGRGSDRGGRVSAYVMGCLGIPAAAATIGLTSILMSGRAPIMLLNLVVMLSVVLGISFVVGFELWRHQDRNRRERTGEPFRPVSLLASWGLFLGTVALCMNVIVALGIVANPGMMFDSSSSSSIASLSSLLAGAGLIFFIGLAGLGLSIAGLFEVRRHPERVGKGLAIAGIVVGVLAIL